MCCMKLQNEATTLTTQRERIEGALAGIGLPRPATPRSGGFIEPPPTYHPHGCGNKMVWFSCHRPLWCKPIPKPCSLYICADSQW